MTMKAMTMALALCLIATVAHTEPTADDKAACGADYRKYCSIVPEDKTQFILECLKQNMSNLSDQCKKHIEKR
jgi:hypothetical protein